jgi:hypothetical protein
MISMQPNTRFFQNDLNQSSDMAVERGPGLFYNKPATIQNEERSPYESRDYADLTIERARESASLIQHQTEAEAQAILAHIERLKSEFEIESRAINERIEKKQRILSKLESLEISFGNDIPLQNPVSAQTEDLYRNLNNQARKLSILTSIFIELQGIPDNSRR